MAAALDIVRKSGSFYSYGELRLGQGREAAKEFLRDHRDTAELIEQEIRAAAEPTIDMVTTEVTDAELPEEEDEA